LDEEGHTLVTTNHPQREGRGKGLLTQGRDLKKKKVLALGEKNRPNTERALRKPGRRKDHVPGLHKTGAIPTSKKICYGTCVIT